MVIIIVIMWRLVKNNDEWSLLISSRSLQSVVYRVVFFSYPPVASPPDLSVFTWIFQWKVGGGVRCVRGYNLLIIPRGPRDVPSSLLIASNQLKEMTWWTKCVLMPSWEMGILIQMRMITFGSNISYTVSNECHLSCRLRIFFSLTYPVKGSPIPSKWCFCMHFSSLLNTACREIKCWGMLLILLTFVPTHHDALL